MNKNNMLALLAIIMICFPGCTWFSKAEEKVLEDIEPTIIVEKILPDDIEKIKEEDLEQIQVIEEPTTEEQEVLKEDVSIEAPVVLEAPQKEKQESILQKFARDPKVKKAYLEWKKSVQAEAEIYESPEYKAFSDVQMKLVQNATNDERVQASIKHIEEVQNQVMKDLGLEKAQERLKELGDPIKQKYDLEAKQFAYQNARDDEREIRQSEFLDALGSTMQELNANEEFRKLSTEMQEVMSQAPEDSRIANAMNDYGKELDGVMKQQGSEELQEQIKDYVAKKRKKINVDGSLAKLKASLGSNVSEEQFYRIISAFEQQKK